MSLSQKLSTLSPALFPTDIRAEWLSKAMGWQADQADAFRRMKHAMRVGDADEFAEASEDHAECYSRYMMYMEMAKS